MERHSALKKIILVSYLSLVFPHFISAQYYYYDDQFYATNFVWDAGLNTGPINSLTDIGGKGRKFLHDLNHRCWRTYYGACIRTSYKERISARLEAGYGHLVGADSLTHTDNIPGGSYERNLSFWTRLTQLQLSFEIYPLSFVLAQARVSPYILGGFGLFHFNPKAMLNQKWYNLQPLRLEGQGFPEFPERKIYRLLQCHIPLATGIKYEFSACIHLRLEMQLHLLFTDYLDDVSTSYIDPSLFYRHLPAAYAIAARLYSRTAEIRPGNIVNPQQSRGNAADRDTYLLFQLAISWSFRPRR